MSTSSTSAATTPFFINKQSSEMKLVLTKGNVAAPHIPVSSCSETTPPSSSTGTPKSVIREPPPKHDLDSFLNKPIVIPSVPKLISAIRNSKGQSTLAQFFPTKTASPSFSTSTSLTSHSHPQSSGPVHKHKINDLLQNHVKHGVSTSPGIQPLKNKTPLKQVGKSPITANARAPSDKMNSPAKQRVPIILAKQKTPGQGVPTILGKSKTLAGQGVPTILGKSKTLAGQGVPTIPAKNKILPVGQGVSTVPAKSKVPAVIVGGVSDARPVHSPVKQQEPITTNSMEHSDICPPKPKKAKTTTSGLPHSRVKMIMKTNIQSSQTTVNTGQESIAVVSKATELFIAELARRSLHAGKEQGLRSVSYAQLAEAVQRSKDLHFLHAVVPKKVLGRDILTPHENTDSTHAR